MSNPTPTAFCPRCQGSGWVCEVHRNKPMNHARKMARNATALARHVKNRVVPSECIRPMPRSRRPTRANDSRHFERGINPRVEASADVKSGRPKRPGKPGLPFLFIRCFVAIVAACSDFCCTELHPRKRCCLPRCALSAECRPAIKGIRTNSSTLPGAFPRERRLWGRSCYYTLHVQTGYCDSGRS
jgi:hypothetical protein